jgi:toxin ParE1/3/4
MTNKIYRLYQKAIEDLESIYLYSVAQFGIKRTDNYILDIEKTFQQLANNPEIARKCYYIRRNLRAITYGSHIIFFKVTSNGIAIIRVLHQSMNHEKHIN